VRLSIGVKVVQFSYILKSFMIAQNKGRVETQPRCKIQYPMKNRGEDADKKSKQSNECQLFLKNK
jgi:hypothetical protein